MAVQVKVISHSISPNHTIPLITMSLRYWRPIHSELMTHREFSRCASSSRAVPVRKMLAQVWNDPALPIHWGVNRPGMQAREQLKGWRLWAAKKIWTLAGRTACALVYLLDKLGLHKQVANRLLEAWQYISVLVTFSGDGANFYGLRDHDAAQPEFQELAKAMRHEMSNSTPTLLEEGEWHLPYVTRGEQYTLGTIMLRKLSTARNARVSYLTHDKKNPDLVKDVELHDTLVGMVPKHASPSEHLAFPDKYSPIFGWAKPHLHGNLTGWIQYRKILESDNLEDDPCEPCNQLQTQAA